MTNSHMHITVIRPMFSVESQKAIKQACTDIELQIDAVASSIAMTILEDSATIGDWADCDDCDEKMHDAHDTAMGMVVNSILESVRKALI